MRIRQERQLNPVADEVLALTAVVRPILTGVLYALKQDVVARLGGYDAITLDMLARVYRGGDGDCGICFEYAVHEAMSRSDPMVLERINDAARLCNVPGKEIKSILFGLEKSIEKSASAAGARGDDGWADDMAADDYMLGRKPAKHVTTFGFDNLVEKLAALETEK